MPERGQAVTVNVSPPISGVLRLQHSVAAVPVARHQIRHELAVAGLTESVLDDVEVVVAELLGNSVRHAAPVAGGLVLLAWRVADDDVVLRVTDGGGGREIRPRHAAPMSDCGRGLQIVERLARVWGVSEHAGGLRSVWAALSLVEPSRALRLVT
ncbi:MAG: serine/threonine-protein kinase RsbW [Actinomycetota bacterium]|nr:serine/threonine-protein kinase RsbW [Actinomycetota bacterium]